MKIEEIIMRCIIILVLFLLVSRQTEAKKILGLFPHFGYSHFKVFYPLLRNLAERGHNVTVITYIKSTESPLQNYEELLLTKEAVINVVPLSEWKPRTWNGLLEEYIGLHEEGQESCERLYKSGHVSLVLQRHKQNPYDIVITEYFNSDCQLAVPYLMQTPIVALSSCLLMPWYYERILLPDTPSFVQSEFIGFPTPLNWYERLTNFLQAKVLSLLYRYYTNQLDNEMIYRHLNIKVDVNAIAKQQTRLIFGNQHYSLMGIRPHSEQFLEIGGIHIQEETVKNAILPPEIEDFLQKTTVDILFISWGSMIRSSTLDQNKLRTILSVLDNLNLKVIWKWETDEVPVKNDKILFVKWAPQLSLMCHPKVKLFWGHGGLLGTTEAVYCGKPMILTPIYGDQFVNAHAVQNRHIGLIVDFDAITETNLNNAIQQILEVSYTNNAKEISRMFRDRAAKPLDTATWWIEHLLNHQRASEVLRTHAVDLNWFVYYSLDSISILMIICVMLILAVKYSIKLVKNAMAGRRRQTVGRDKKSK